MAQGTKGINVQTEGERLCADELAENDDSLLLSYLERLQLVPRHQLGSLSATSTQQKENPYVLASELTEPPSRSLSRCLPSAHGAGGWGLSLEKPFTKALPCK